jgi:hypothetical protein
MLADAGSMSKYDISVSDILQRLPPAVLYKDSNVDKSWEAEDVVDVGSEKPKTILVTEEEEDPSW